MHHLILALALALQTPQPTLPVHNVPLTSKPIASVPPAVESGFTTPAGNAKPCAMPGQESDYVYPGDGTRLIYAKPWNTDTTAKLTAMPVCAEPPMRK